MLVDYLGRATPSSWAAACRPCTGAPGSCRGLRRDDQDLHTACGATQPPSLSQLTKQEACPLPSALATNEEGKALHGRTQALISSFVQPAARSCCWLSPAHWAHVKTLWRDAPQASCSAAAQPPRLLFTAGPAATQNSAATGSSVSSSGNITGGGAATGEHVINAKTGRLACSAPAAGRTRRRIAHPLTSTQLLR